MTKTWCISVCQNSPFAKTAEACQIEMVKDLVFIKDLFELCQEKYEMFWDMKKILDFQFANTNALSREKIHYEIF